MFVVLIHGFMLVFSEKLSTLRAFLSNTKWKDFEQCKDRKANGQSFWYCSMLLAVQGDVIWHLIGLMSIIELQNLLSFFSQINLHYLDILLHYYLNARV